MKKITKIFMGLMILAGLTACGTDNNQDDTSNTGGNGSTSETTAFDYSDVKIGILGHMQSGETLDALTVYMDALSDEIGFTYEYVLGSSYDEQTNITAAQNLISSGVDGIIMTFDSGTDAILEEAESAGVFLSAFLTEFDSVYDDIKSSDHFLGVITDGLYDNASIGEKAAELIINDDKKNVGVVTFPLLYFPQKAGAIEAFTNKIEEHNATASEPIELYETQELDFSLLDETYFNTYPEVDAIFSLASNFVHPAMVNADRTDVKLYTTGFKPDDVAAFEKEEIGMMTLSNIEAVAYPLSLILNEVAGTQFSDKPEEAERVGTSVVFITDDEGLAALQEKTFFFTADIEDAFISPEDFKEYLTSYNSEASYEELKDVLMNMGIEDLIAK